MLEKGDGITSDNLLDIIQPCGFVDGETVPEAVKEQIPANAKCAECGKLINGRKGGFLYSDYQGFVHMKCFVMENHWPPEVVEEIVTSRGLKE